jgi:protein O-mannosyl-transferase
LQPQRKTDHVKGPNKNTRLMLFSLVAFACALATWSGLAAKPLYYDDWSVVLHTRQQNAQSLNLSQVLFRHEDFGERTPRPVTSLSYVFDLQYNPCNLLLCDESQLDSICPPCMHLTNLLLHGLGVAALFLLLSQFIKASRAFLGALLFATHPLLANTIAFPGFREDIISMLLGTLALAAFVQYLRSDRFQYSVLSGLLFLAAIFSKENVVFLPLVFLVIAFVEKGRDWKLRPMAYLKALAPIIAVSLIHMLIYFYYSKSTVPADYFGDTYFERLLTIGRPLGRAVWMPLAPVGQRLVYDYFSPCRDASSYLGLALFAALAAAGIVAVVKRNPVSIGLITFGATFIPTSNIIVLIWHVFAERYLYFPTAGLIFAISVSLSGFLENREYKRRSAIFVVIAIIIAVVFCFATQKRIRVLVDDQRAWAESVERSPGNPLAHNSLATIKWKRSNFDECVTHARRALDLMPGYSNAGVNLLRCLHSLGDDEGALHEIDRRPALAAHPDIANLKALSLIRLERYDEAIQFIETELQGRPGDKTSIRFYLAALIKSGNCVKLVEFQDRYLGGDDMAARALIKSFSQDFKRCRSELDSF